MSFRQTHIGRIFCAIDLKFSDVTKMRANLLFPVLGPTSLWTAGWNSRGSIHCPSFRTSRSDLLVLSAFLFWKRGLRYKDDPVQRLSSEKNIDQNQGGGRGWGVDEPGAAQLLCGALSVVEGV